MVPNETTTEADIPKQDDDVWTRGPDGELIPDYDATFPVINEGEVVSGKVVRVDKDEVLVDIGYKSEGVIPVSELSIRRSVNPADEVNLGDEIDALVMTKEDADGRLILSKKRARFEMAWKRIEGAAESGEPVEGIVIEVVKGGLILDLGVRGFLPASLVDIRRVQDLDEFMSQTLRCKVIELNRSRNNVVLSRRAVLEEERREMRQAILDRLSPGDVVEGTISNIVDFGAFVDLEGIDGLIHISELSWSHVNHPSELLEIGQEVRVKVLDIDRERQRISLGLKQTQSDPWQQVIDTYQQGDVVEGRVTKVVTFGAFVEVDPRRRRARAHLGACHAPRRKPARGGPAGRDAPREDHRDGRRAATSLPLAQAGRRRRGYPPGHRRGGPRPRSLRRGLRGERGRGGRPRRARDRARGELRPKLPMTEVEPEPPRPSAEPSRSRAPRPAEVEPEPVEAEAEPTVAEPEIPAPEAHEVVADEAPSEEEAAPGDEASAEPDDDAR